MDPDPSSSIIVLAISLLASAFFSGMEMAFVASSRLQTELNAQTSIRGKIVAGLSNKPQLFIASMLVGNNLALVICGIESGALISHWLFGVSGWQEASKVGLFAFIETYLECGLRHTLCTDIDRDGDLSGCNRDLYQMVKQAFPDLSLQASGGVSELGDLVGLTADGVIIGKALYEGRFNVKDALEAVRC